MQAQSGPGLLGALSEGAPNTARLRLRLSAAVRLVPAPAFEYSPDLSRIVRISGTTEEALESGELITGVNRGHAGPVTGHFPKELPYAIDMAPKTDREQAKKLLDEAGWRVGPDGMRSKDGQKLHFRIMTYTYWQPTAVALQSQWKQVGISSELQPVEQTASNQVMFDGSFDIATYCSCGVATGDIAGQLTSFYRTGVANNFGGYSNPQVDALID